MSDYPDASELERISTWPFDDPAGWFEFIRENWWAEDWGWHQEGGDINISTGGWSGNEDRIVAMTENVMLWNMTWQSSRRGGHYVFSVPVLAHAANEHSATEEEA